MIIEPALRPGTSVTHVVFGGRDGYRSVVSIEDALAGDVLIAERLRGCPRDGDHGAPARLVSPNQYGFVSTKHLCRIALHTAKPTEDDGHASPLRRVVLRSPSFKRHPRATVWEEERHPSLPAWSVRPVYRLLTPPIAFSALEASGAVAPRRRPRRRHPRTKPSVIRLVGAVLADVPDEGQAGDRRYLSRSVPCSPPARHRRRRSPGL